MGQHSNNQDSNKKALQALIFEFNRLQRVDKNALENLRRLADMAEKNPAKYFMALKFL